MTKSGHHLTLSKLFSRYVWKGGSKVEPEFLSTLLALAIPDHAHLIHPNNPIEILMAQDQKG